MIYILEFIITSAKTVLLFSLVAPLIFVVIAGFLSARKNKFKELA